MLELLTSPDSPITGLRGISTFWFRSGGVSGTTLGGQQLRLGFSARFRPLGSDPPHTTVSLSTCSDDAVSVVHLPQRLALV